MQVARHPMFVVVNKEENFVGIKKNQTEAEEGTRLRSSLVEKRLRGIASAFFLYCIYPEQFIRRFLAQSSLQEGLIGSHAVSSVFLSDVNKNKSMTKVITFTGIDISKLSFDACILTEEGTENHRTFSYDKDAMKTFLQWLPAGSHCVMEATGVYHLRLACYLSEKGITVSVVNPLVIKRFSQMRLIRAKTDKSDARMIAAYGKTEQPLLWQPPKAYQVKLQQMDSLLQQLQKQHSALLCQQEAFTASGMMDKEVKRFLQKSIVHLDRQITGLEDRMEAIITEHQGQMADNITTIPGIGKKTAIVLMVLSDCFQKFSSYKQLSAYVGLSPRIYESGTSVKGKAAICKMGMSRVRALLYVCAWSASRYNKACRELYERLLKANKPKKVALIAVANKLIKLAFAIAKSNTEYKENYSKNICS